MAQNWLWVSQLAIIFMMINFHTVVSLILKVTLSGHLQISFLTLLSEFEQTR